MEDFLFLDKDWFYKKYADKSKERFWTFKIALNLFLQRQGSIIVETGCLRQKDDWGAGQSTLLFGEFCHRYGKKLYTVDNNAEHLLVAKEVTEPFKENIEYILGDSHLFLENFNKKIDLLYLDSLDADPNNQQKTREAQLHQLVEIQLALPKLSEKAIVLLDDNNLPFGGKTYLSKDFLKEKGFTLLMDYHQSLWTK